MTIGEKIKKLRAENEVTQVQVAEKLNISVQAVSKWERGINLPDITLLLPLSRIFGITVDELLTSQDKPDFHTERFKNRRNLTPIESYTAAREAMTDDYDNLDFVEWCAESSFLLARDEDCNAELFDEMTENAIRLYERVIDSSYDETQLSRAYIGVIHALRMCGRDIEAEWYASIYPQFSDKNIPNKDEAEKICAECEGNNFNLEQVIKF